MTLDDLWDFDDPAASESRFRQRLAAAQGDDRLETLTQVARALGLQGRFDEAGGTLDEVASALPTASGRTRTRYLLERGRVLRSAGRPDEAVPLFRQAIESGVAAGEHGLAVDAVHMAALATADPAEQMSWHERGIAMAEASADDRVRTWLPSLRNNLGWSLFEAGRLTEALDQFERAAAERRAMPDEKRRRIADWAVARALRALGRVDAALEIQRRLLAEWTEAGVRPPYVNEELGECLLALGRGDDARPYFAEAHALLCADTAFAATEAARLARIATLAGLTSAPGSV